MMLNRAVLLAACLSATLPTLAQTTTSNAASGPGGPFGGQPPGPPPEAVAACKGKAEGAQVSFTLRNGATLSGSCQKFGDTLAARPAGGGPPPTPAR